VSEYIMEKMDSAMSGMKGREGKSIIGWKGKSKSQIQKERQWMYGLESCTYFRFIRNRNCITKKGNGGLFLLGGGRWEVGK
jgi:hypothetical protein